MERLLEREAELAMLDGVVGRAVDGQGALVLLGGEAGAGKTSLTRVLRDRWAGRAAFVCGSCEPLSVPVPLGPIRELFVAAGVDSVAATDADDRLSLATRLVCALGELEPIVAVIEDAHWADPMTLDVVRLLARRVEDRRVAVIVTYRAEEAPANPELALLLGDLATGPAVLRLELRPLSESAIGELARPAGLDPSALARLTGGNPFLVVESIAAGGRLPASVRDAALARVARLTDPARAVVEAAAVLGQRFAPALLARLVPDSGDAVEEALARGVLLADGATLGFRHELIRAAIESSISPPRRSRLHASVVTALEAQPDGANRALLAHHAELGGLSDQACRYAIAAAAEAESIGALQETRLQAERALGLGHSLAPHERLDVLLQYVRAANFSSTALDEVATAGERAVALARDLGDSRREGRALTLLAWALWSADRVVEAKAAAAAAVSVLEATGDTASLVRARSTLIRMDATAFDPADAVAAGPSARELAVAAGLDETAIEITISVALAHGQRGDRRAIAMLQEAREQAHGRGYTIQTVRAYVNLLCVSAALREHAVIDATLDEALRTFDEIYAPIPALAVHSFVARSQLDRGRFAGRLGRGTAG